MRLAIGACLLVLAAGCSGINHTQSVSPATFLLPGLLQNTAPQPGETLPLEDSQIDPAQS